MPFVALVFACARCHIRSPASRPSKRSARWGALGKDVLPTDVKPRSPDSLSFRHDWENISPQRTRRAQQSQRKVPQAHERHEESWRSLTAFGMTAGRTPPPTVIRKNLSQAFAPVASVAVKWCALPFFRILAPRYNKLVPRHIRI